MTVRQTARETDCIMSPIVKLKDQTQRCLHADSSVNNHPAVFVNIMTERTILACSLLMICGIITVNAQNLKCTNPMGNVTYKLGEGK